MQPESLAGEQFETDCWPSGSEEVTVCAQACSFVCVEVGEDASVVSVGSLVAGVTSKRATWKANAAPWDGPLTRQSLDVTVTVGPTFSCQEATRQFALPLAFTIRSFLPSPLLSLDATMSVRVVARIRPLLKHELDKDTIVTAETLEGDARPVVVRIPSPKNDAESFSFQFSSVYEQDATQQQLFDAESE